MPPHSLRLRKSALQRSSKIDFKRKKAKTNDTYKNNFPNSNREETAIFYLPAYVAFKAVFCFRIISAIWLHISDYDETFSYWEPPWDYLPQKALKSYLYLLIHAVPAWIYNELFHPSRLLLFYFIRSFLALICSVSEVFFYMGVCREFGINVGRITLIILMFSPGMFTASTAFVPASFAMYTSLLALASWFHRKHALAVFLVVLSSFIGWPFAALIGLPIAYEMIVLKKKLRKFINWFVLSTFTALVPLIDIDSSYYNKFTFILWNVLKNTLSVTERPRATDTESWNFYIFNGFLNFNIIFVICLLTPFLLVWIKIILPRKPRNRDCFPYTLSLGSLYLWLAFFCLWTNKKERFLYPIYPLIALSAAVGIDAMQVLWFRYFIKKGFHYSKCAVKLSFIVLVGYSLLGVSRMLALYRAYHAPMDVFIDLTNVDANFTRKIDVNLCIGKEWVRFPSSYFLPDRWKLHFIKSKYIDQLEGHYFHNIENESKTVHEGFKNFNLEEYPKYVDIDHCDYLIDLDSTAPSEIEPSYSSHRNWTILVASPFLDMERTSWILRTFYIPVVWEKSGTFLSYNLLKRNRIPQNKTF